jgi:ATP-dependent protease ClpP protease subunit
MRACMRAGASHLVLGKIYADAAAASAATANEGGKSWFKIKPAVTAELATAGNPVAAPQILVYDEIGAYGVNVDSFHRALKSLGEAKDIDMRINSPGGDSFSGIAIHNILAAHSANITAYVDGFAASAASLIAMAADKIVMPENTFMVVHDPYAMTIGPASAHRSMADDLDRVSSAYAQTYATRSKQPLDKVKALMAEDRLMGAPECKELGYCDELVPAKEMAATFKLSKLPDKYRSRVEAVYGAAVAADAATAVEKIKALGAQAKVEQAFIDAHVAAGSTVKQFRKALLAKLIGLPADTTAPAAAAGASSLQAVGEYGMAEIEATMELCAIAKVGADQANRFIGAKVPLAKVREFLAARAASAADRAAIERVDVTNADVGVRTPAHASESGGDPRVPDPGIVARKQRINELLRAEEKKQRRIA